MKQGARRRSIETQLGTFLNRHVPGLRKIDSSYTLMTDLGSADRKGACYVFPTLRECREALAKKMEQEMVWNEQSEWIKAAIDREELPF